jgi:hypothetical protein
MLPGSPPAARRRKIFLVTAAMADCGYAAFLLLTGPPTHVPAFAAFACVVIGNAAVVFVGWRADDGLLVPAVLGEAAGEEAALTGARWPVTPGQHRPLRAGTQRCVRWRG